jgi:hypothetical protein
LFNGKPKATLRFLVQRQAEGDGFEVAILRFNEGNAIDQPVIGEGSPPVCVCDIFVFVTSRPFSPFQGEKVAVRPDEGVRPFKALVGGFRNQTESNRFIPERQDRRQCRVTMADDCARKMQSPVPARRD